MKGIRPEQVEFAIVRLGELMKTRDLNQVKLQHLSGVAQSTISKMFNRTAMPSAEVLRKLFDAIGVRLDEVLEEPEAEAREIIGYLATPLTGVANDGKKDAELRRAVGRIKGIASAADFSDPAFEIYWPGDYTHPVRHSEFSGEKVYLIDRSRASSYDFIILLCAEPSYGMGQENEIGTQAGVPAIRLLPQGISRMMSGSFVKSTDISFSGSLASAIDFDEGKLHGALQAVRVSYFSRRALYQGLNGEGFGEHLRRLVNSRCGNYQDFADKLGVGLSYVHAMMDEPLTVSNPSARLLKRIARILDVSVGYLLGEAPELDGVWTDSKGAWSSWMRNNDGLNGRVAVEILEEWQNSYRAQRNQATLRSFRRDDGAMREVDWDKRYHERMQLEEGHARQSTLL